MDRTRSRKRMHRLRNIRHKSGPTDRAQSVEMAWDLYSIVSIIGIMRRSRPIADRSMSDWPSRDSGQFRGSDTVASQPRQPAGSCE